MSRRFPIPIRPRRSHSVTLVEFLITMGLASIVLTVVAFLFISGLRSFAGLGNYAQLTGQSRQSLDIMSRDVREATQIIDAHTNLPIRWLTLTNASDGTTTKLTWDSSAGTLTRSKTGQPVRTNLTGCSRWTFSLYQRTPTNNWIFYGTTNNGLCKLINLSWKCSRTILGRKLNTEEVTTAQIVLRNKP